MKSDIQMLDILSYDELASQVGMKFLIVRLPGSVEIELIKVTERRADRRQESFSLVFLGPGKEVLPQCIYMLQREGVEAGSLFLVPTAMTERGVEYEAAFNRLLENAA